jgi:hypothetical protein
MFMEKLDINNGGGQGYGFTVYRTCVTEKCHMLKLHTVKDRALVRIILVAMLSNVHDCIVAINFFQSEQCGNAVLV